MVAAQAKYVLIDPLAYFRGVEAELAMSILSGGYSARACQDGYRVGPLVPLYTQQADIYNLYHLNLLGSLDIGKVVVGLFLM
jgi:fructosamine-3-kinase